jgi:hypothetical protein
MYPPFGFVANNRQPIGAIFHVTLLNDVPLACSVLMKFFALAIIRAAVRNGAFFLRTPFRIFQEIIPKLPIFITNMINPPFFKKIQELKMVFLQYI